MNIYTLVFTLPFICVAKSSVMIDGEMTFDVQVLKHNDKKYDKGRVLDDAVEEMKQIGENYKYNSVQKRQPFEEIRQLDQIKQSKEDNMKAVDSRQGLQKKRKEKLKEGNENVLTGVKGNYERDVDKKNSTEGDPKVQLEVKSGEHEVELVGVVATRAARLECEYQLPERRHAEALLSRMMNQLTRLIISAHEHGEGNAGDVSDSGNVGNASYAGDVGKTANMGTGGRTGNMGSAGGVGNTGGANDARRLEKRFRVVNDRSPAVFEAIFKQLTQEYREFYNTTVQSIDGSRERCAQQAVARDAWRALLAGAQRALRRAARRALGQLPRGTGAAGVRRGERRRLDAELERMRYELLSSLCDTFRLCYDDLL